PASSVNDLGFNDEAHRAGLILLVRPRARDKASQSPAGESATIIKWYYHWNNRIFDRHASPPAPLPAHERPRARRTRDSAHPIHLHKEYSAGAESDRLSG